MYSMYVNTVHIYRQHIQKAAYSDVSCEVKVGARRSDPFEVSCGIGKLIPVCQNNMH